MDTRHLIYLHGGLGDTYGREAIVIYARGLHDIVRGLTNNLGRGFLNEIRSGSWHVAKGKPKVEGDTPTEGDRMVAEVELGMYLRDEEIHIYPKVEGALALVGGALAGLGASTGTVTAVTSLGGLVGGAAGATGIVGATLGTAIIDIALTVAASAALNAVISAISSPQMNYDDAEVDRSASFLYNGVVNVTEQGGAVPLVYGKHLAGSTVISANMVSLELGEAGNELPVEDYNFLLPLSSNWNGADATLSLADIDSVRYLEINKTANGTYGGAELALTLEDATEYKLTVTYKGLASFLDPLEYINFQARDSGTQLKHVRAKVVWQSDDKGYAQLTFTTLATQVTPRILIYADEASPSGTISRIRTIKVEKVHV